MPRRTRSFRLATLMVLIAAVAVGLGALRDRSSARTAWSREIRDPDEMIRASARLRASLHAVPGLSRRDEARALVDALDDRDPGVRLDAMAALRDSDPLPARAVPKLATLARDPVPYVRAHAAHALGSAFDPGVAGPGPAARLLPMLADPEPTVRCAAVRALGDVVARSPRADPLAIRPIVARLGDADADVRVAAAAASERVGRGSEGLPALESFVLTHRDDDCQLAFPVLEALAGRSDEAVRVLVARALFPGDGPSGAVLGGLSRLAARGERDRRRVEGLAPGVGPDQGADRRAAAALVLGEIGSARSAVPILIEAASHPDWRVRRVAVRHLAALRPYGPAVLQALRGVADRDDAYPVRDLAAQALDDR